MPWFPDFVAAVELARRPTGGAGQDDPVGQYLAAIERGDARALEVRWPGEVSVFDPRAGAVRGHRQLREFVEQSQALLAEIGPFHRGTDELRSFFATAFGGGGGIGLDLCTTTDDGVRCAAEYNCVRWGSHALAPQAGIAVFERGGDRLLAGVRVYDDVEVPESLTR